MPHSRVARRLFTLATGLLVAVSCGGRSPSSPTAPAPTASLDSAFALARQQPNLLSLVVVRDNVVVRQEYFNGGGPDTPHDVRSVTKSVVSLLVGIAIDRGYLRSIDQPVGEVLGPLGPSDPAKAVVTVRQLLTMTSGIGGDELADVNEYNRWALAPNQLEYVWALPVQAASGARFAYFSPAYHVLSPILTRSCRQSTSDFARDTLFAPLGIGAREWETDSQGFDNGAAGLRLTPTDMVAIGNLVLNGGRAGGRQVVPATWMADATTARVATQAQPYVSGYGLGWWTGQLNGRDFAFANGYGGQFIVVVPRTRLLVTAGTRWQGVGSAASAQWRAVFDIIMQRIVPAF